MEIVLGNSVDATRTDAVAGEQVRVRSRRGLRPSARLLIDGIPKRLAPGARVLAVCDAEAVVALAASLLHPEAAVHHLDLDLYDAARARRTVRANSGRVTLLAAADIPHGAPEPPAAAGGAATIEAPEAVEAVTAVEAVKAVESVAAPEAAAAGAEAAAAEPPEAAATGPAPWDLILLAGPKENLLLRDLVEEAHDALAQGGRLLVAADRTPKQLVELVKGVFGKADRQGGVKDQCELVAARRQRAGRALRERARLVEREVRGLRLRLWGRPGVFHADGVDPGTRALIERVEVPAGARVIDLGCGTGALGIAAALLGGGPVTLVDSSLRAVECARRSAEASGVASFEALARKDLEDLPGEQDLALANPPYFADFRIAHAFIAAAWRTLRPGGRLWLVAKNADAHADLVREGFGAARVEVAPGGYGIISAEKRRGS